MKRTQSSKGFTLVEVLVSLLILSVVAIGFFYVTGANANLFKTSDERSKITVYAQDILERVKINWSDATKFENRDAIAVPVPPVAGYTVDPLKVEFLKPDGTVVTSGTYVTNPILYKVTLTIKYKSAVYYTVSVRIGHPVPPTT